MAKKVLVIDDEEDFRVLINDVLSEKGYEVVLASDGMEGIEKAKESRPDVCLVDWMMPELDGKAFIQKLRQIPGFEGIPAIMLTTLDSDDRKMEALAFGAADYICKPFRFEALVETIEKALSQKTP